MLLVVRMEMVQDVIEIEKQDDLLGLCRPQNVIRFCVDKEFEENMKSSLLEHAGSVFKEDFTTKFPSLEETRQKLQY